MVVVTLGSTEDAAAPTVNLKSSLLLAEEAVAPASPPLPERQCIVSKRMLHSSPDKVLILKVPLAAAAAEALAPPPSPLHQPAVGLRRIVSDEDATRKRPAIQLSRMPCNNNSHSNKKARLVLLPAAVRRTVHFELQDDSNSLIRTHVRFFDRLEAVDVANAWWSRQEMMDIMSREKSQVSVMSFCCNHYTTEVLNLMRMARDKSSLPGMASQESSSPLWVANSPARGLERDIVQGFKQRKRQVIRKVLESQRVLKQGRHQVTGELAPLEVQTQLLSNQYSKWSQPMVRFAQVLAEGDAQVVIDNATAAAAAASSIFGDLCEI